MMLRVFYCRCMNTELHDASNPQRAPVERSPKFTAEQIASNAALRDFVALYALLVNIQARHHQRKGDQEKENNTHI